LAARRAGVETFVLPKRNEADLDDLPQELKDDMTFILAETMDDVLDAAMPEEFTNRRRLHKSSAQTRAEVSEVREPAAIAS
jgi:ATP-dependent Lon protease